jgi:excisionase family DNA binding protein
MADRCLTPAEYAGERRVSVRTVYRLIYAGRIPAERVGHQWRIWVGPKLRTGQHATPAPRIPNP